MFIATSDSPHGPGILVLQHEDFDKHSPKWSVDLRGSLRAVRVKDRLDKDLGLGQWTYDTESAGDIHGGQLLKNKTRPIPMWRFATPVVTTEPDGGAVATGANTSPAFAVRPIFGAQYGPDFRMKTLTPDQRRGSLGKFWPKFPMDFVGISLTSNYEAKQYDLYHDTDPRLVAVNVKPDALMGSWVCDMGAGFKVDPDRNARLQSMMRVVRPKPGCLVVPPDPDRSGKYLNGIAWQLATGGQDGVWGYGLVIDRAGGKAPPKAQEPVATQSSQAVVQGLSNPAGSLSGGPAAPPQSPLATPPPAAPASKGFTVAMTSWYATGPFDVGEAKGDKHEVTQTEDEEAVNSNHITTNALFKKPNDAVRDAPIDFDGDWIEPAQAPNLVYAYLRYDNNKFHSHVCGSKRGLWRIEATCFMRSPPVETPSVPPVPTRTGVPTSTTGVPTTTTPTHPWVSGDDHEAYAVSSMQTAFPAVLFQPQDLRSNAEDLRVETVPSAAGVFKHDSFAPMVLRAEAFGAKQAKGWDYTTGQRPCRGRWRGGASDGGIVFLPPEVSIDDHLNAYVPPGRTISTAYVVAGPGTYFAAGLPDLTRGDVDTGYRWGATSDGSLQFDQLNASGTVTANVLTLDENGRVGINTANPATAFHAATADVRLDLTRDALGGGLAATLGTIAGSGPTRDTQERWARINISGTTYWIPTRI
jgi:hypothetical protein